MDKQNVLTKTWNNTCGYTSTNDRMTGPTGWQSPNLHITTNIIQRFVQLRFYLTPDVILVCIQRSQNRNKCGMLLHSLVLWRNHFAVPRRHYIRLPTPWRNTLTGNAVNLHYSRLEIRSSWKLLICAPLVHLRNYKTNELDHFPLLQKSPM